MLFFAGAEIDDFMADSKFEIKIAIKSSASKKYLTRILGLPSMPYIIPHMLIKQFQQ